MRLPLRSRSRAWSRSAASGLTYSTRPATMLLEGIRGKFSPLPAVRSGRSRHSRRPPKLQLSPIFVLRHERNRHLPGACVAISFEKKHCARFFAEFHTGRYFIRNRRLPLGSHQQVAWSIAISSSDSRSANFNSLKSRRNCKSISLIDLTPIYLLRIVSHSHDERNAIVRRGHSCDCIPSWKLAQKQAWPLLSQPRSLHFVFIAGSPCAFIFPGFVSMHACLSCWLS